MITLSKHVCPHNALYSSVCLGLDCLCSILKCMVEWSRDYYIDPATTGLNAVYRSTSGSDDTDNSSMRQSRAASVNIKPEPSK